MYLAFWIWSFFSSKAPLWHQDWKHHIGEMFHCPVELFHFSRGWMTNFFVAGSEGGGFSNTLGAPLGWATKPQEDNHVLALCSSVSPLCSPQFLASALLCCVPVFFCKRYLGENAGTRFIRNGNLFSEAGVFAFCLSFSLWRRKVWVWVCRTVSSGTASD